MALQAARRERKISPVPILIVGITGGSRGGSPTYLAKIRDNLTGGAHQINRAIVVIGSVTDFLSTDIKTACGIYIANDGYVPEATYHYYEEDYNVFARVLKPYLEGTLTFADARKRLVGASPKYFAADYLYNVQVNHGLLDEACRVAQTTGLLDVLYPQLDDYLEYRIYWQAGHQIDLTDTSDYHNYNQTYEYATQRWLQKIIDGD